jgi:hypothetical protein
VSHVSEDMVLSVQPQPRIARWLYSEMQTLFSVKDAKTRLAVKNVKEGEIYGACFLNPVTKRQEFQRAKVLSLWKANACNDVEVLLVDHGPILTLHRSKLRSFPRKSQVFQNLCAQVVLKLV